MNNFMKTALKNILVFISAAFLWQIVSEILDNPIIFPTTIEIGKTMLMQLRSPDFFSIIGITLIRIFTALFLSYSIGLLLSFGCFQNQRLKFIIDRLVQVLRSIPNISMIIIILFWLPREVSVILVVFLLVFPIVYTSNVEELISIQYKWHDVLVIYPQPFFRRCKVLYLPKMKNTLRSSLITASSTCFKATVTAEVLCQIAYGLGKSMQFEKLNLEIAGVIGWTIWLLILSAAADSLLKRILNKL